MRLRWILFSPGDCADAPKAVVSPLSALSNVHFPRGAAPPKPEHRGPDARHGVEQFPRLEPLKRVRLNELPPQRWRRPLPCASVALHTPAPLLRRLGPVCSASHSTVRTTGYFCALCTPEGRGPPFGWNACDRIDQEKRTNSFLGHRGRALVGDKPGSAISIALDTSGGTVALLALSADHAVAQDASPLLHKASTDRLRQCRRCSLGCALLRWGPNDRLQRHNFGKVKGVSAHAFRWRLFRACGVCGKHGLVCGQSLVGHLNVVRQCGSQIELDR